MPLTIDMRTIARVQVVAWEDGEWGIVWETKDGQRGADRIGKRADAEAIVLAVWTHDADVTRARWRR